MRQDIKTLFLKLCADDTPFVRRAAAQNILSMIKISRGPDGLVDYITAFKSFARDDQVRLPYLSVFCVCVFISPSPHRRPQDSIRIQVVPIAIALLGQVSAETMVSTILPSC